MVNFLLCGTLHFPLRDSKNVLLRMNGINLLWFYSIFSLSYCNALISPFNFPFLNRVEIEQLGHPNKHTFCGEDKPFQSGVQKRVVWKAECPDNRFRDPRQTLIGTVLNADPLGNAKYVFDQVKINDMHFFYKRIAFRKNKMEDCMSDEYNFCCILKLTIKTDVSFLPL